MDIQKAFFVVMRKRKNTQLHKMLRRYTGIKFPSHINETHLGTKLSLFLRKVKIRFKKTIYLDNNSLIYFYWVLTVEQVLYYPSLCRSYHSILTETLWWAPSAAGLIRPLEWIIASCRTMSMGVFLWGWGEPVVPHFFLFVHWG